MITAQAMFIAGMHRPRPDAIDKTQLLDFLQAQKRRGANQLFLARPEGDQIIQTIAHSTNGLFVRQQGKTGLIQPARPHVRQHNTLVFALNLTTLLFRAHFFGTLSLHTHAWIVAEDQEECPALKTHSDSSPSVTLYTLESKGLSTTNEKLILNTI